MRAVADGTHGGTVKTRAIARWASLPLLALCWTAPALSQTWTADNGNGTFSNPLFFDEFSDPDLIRVGSDYYMTGTTMHSMPGLPVLRSRDLVRPRVRRAWLGVSRRRWRRSFRRGRR